MYKSSQEKKWESVNIFHVKEGNLEKKEQDKSVPSRGGETTGWHFQQQHIRESGVKPSPTMEMMESPCSPPIITSFSQKCLCSPVYVSLSLTESDGQFFSPENYEVKLQHLSLCNI